MTLDEMVADLQSRIGSTPEITGTRFYDWINQGMRSFCMESDFSWLEKKQTTSTVASQSDYALPTDFKRMVEIRIDETDDNPNIYRLVPHETRSQVESSEKTYSIFNKTLSIKPTPSSTGDQNIEMWYIRRPTNMTSGSESPSDSTIANMPEEYHEACILYAYAIYQAYDEEHDEKRDIMGNPNAPVPGTFYYFVDIARREDSKQKRGGRRKMVSKQEFIGYSEPNRVAKSSVLRL